MSTKLGVGLYCVAALWLAAFVAYLVYLLLPFGVGVSSSLAAALVALGLLAWLLRSLVWRPLRRGGPLGRRRLAVVLTLAAATLALDAGWTHYLVSFPPTDQDDCRFGSIGPEEFRALKREMAAMPSIDWEKALEAERRADGVAMALRERLEQVLSSRPSSDEKIAAMHALMRSIGQ